VSSIGLCVSPGNIPDNTELIMLRPAFLRSILLNVVDDLEVLLATGLPLLITLNNEADMVAGWNGWDEACSYIGQRARGQLIGLTAGNELDVYWSHNPDDVPPSFGADLVNRAQRALRPLGIPVGTTSLGGPRWPEYLTQMLQQCQPDFVALNPYGWIFDGIEAKIDAVRSAAPGLPIKFSELGCKVGDAGGEDGQARALSSAATVVARDGIDASWFAWRDQVGTPDERGDAAFGLVAEDGRRRPAWAAFAALAPSVIDVVTPEPDPPLPAPQPVPVHTDDQEVTVAPLTRAYRQLWQAVVPLPYDEKIAEFGIPTYWREHIAELGSPLAPEIDDEDGSKLQSFASGAILRWRDGAVERVA
jgi:hypothetical protein